ncbi:MAG: permease prefix domain 1-containing protein, partial [Acidobacteria bacterium]|nr:permease prefix domain 1-containing protein [Acidobacteriota bacterium]
MTEQADATEAQIAQWRNWLRRRPAIRPPDVDELEGHLRDQIAALVGAGLSGDEAFLVAVKRMGSLDAVSREFAREHSDRLWKQLVVAPGSDAARGWLARREFLVVLGLAVAAALAVKVPELFGRRLGEDAFYALNASLFVLPLLTGYFAWKRGIERSRYLWLALPFVAGAVAINTIPFTRGGHTEALAAGHLPIALWLAVGVAYAGGRWWSSSGRMDFVRFSGEHFIYYVLMALGGGVLTMFTVGAFGVIGLDAENLAGRWILPCGAMGAVLVGAWLVEAKQSVIENMAPV